MVKIRYLDGSGDSAKTCNLQEATEILEKEMKPESEGGRGMLVINEDERTIVTRATNGQLKPLKANSNIAVHRPVAGG